MELGAKPDEDHSALLHALPSARGAGPAAERPLLEPEFARAPEPASRRPDILAG